MTGEERRAHIFVAVLGASNYTYTEARWSEALPEWIGAHVNAFNAIAGVAGAVVCDNLKAGVTATCRYEPGINRTYQDLATHYGTVILPTRPRKPRDKAKVEVGVLIVERYVLARLRNRRFFSLFELNAAIREIVVDLNTRIMRKLGVSRLELLETIERPALKELPSEPYQYAEWKKCRVAPDYHVEVERHYYSVPSCLIREQVEARITDRTIEIFHKGSRIASHPRSNVRHRHTTVREHMPSSHRRYAEWTPARMMREARKIGPATIALVQVSLVCPESFFIRRRRPLVILSVPSQRLISPTPTSTKCAKPTRRASKSTSYASIISTRLPSHQSSLMRRRSWIRMQFLKDGTKKKAPTASASTS
jgi:transposase